MKTNKEQTAKLTKQSNRAEVVPAVDRERFRHFLFDPADAQPE